MHLRLNIVAMVLVLAALSCARPYAPIASNQERVSIQESLSAFKAFWLDPAGVPPPSIDPTVRRSLSGDTLLSITPIRVEDAPWNQWLGPGARLFNNRAGYFFTVRVRGAGALRWIPAGSGLELNVDGSPLPAIESPEELLAPLLAAALDQERFVLEGDLVDRTRAAGPFRAAYMPVAAAADEIEGVIAFFAEDSDAHIVGMRVTVAIQSESGLERHAVIFD